MKYLCESCVNFPCSKDMHMMQSSCPIYSPEPKPTNYDRLRAMSVEEMAKWAAELSCHPAANRETCIDHDRDCEDCWLDWLKEEVAEE